VKLKMRPEDSDTLKVDADAVVIQTGIEPNIVDKGGVRYDWDADDVDTADTYIAWWEVTETASGKTQDTPDFVVEINEHDLSLLSTKALTTLVAAREFTPGIRDASDDSQDGKLIRLINAYSQAIITYTGREWKPYAAAAARSFLYQGRYVSLEPYDLRTVTSVVLYTDLPTGDQVTLEVGSSLIEREYRLRPANRTPEGTYTALILPRGEHYSRTVDLHEYTVTITGDWGIADTVDGLPDDVELACLISVADAFQNPTGLEQRAFGPEVTIGEAITPFGETYAGSLPQEARALLFPYKRHPTAGGF
jgi:hypothetical protein